MNDRMSEVLKFAGTVRTSATTSRFYARQNFVVDTTSSAAVRIGHISPEFRGRFLFGSGKIEPILEERTLGYGDLIVAAVDMPLNLTDVAIVPEIDGEDIVELSLSEPYDLLRKQANGKSGALLLDGSANIMYARDQSGELCTIYIRWEDDSWNIFARAIHSPRMWFPGNRVFYWLREV